MCIILYKHDHHHLILLYSIVTILSGTGKAKVNTIVSNVKTLAEVGKLIYKDLFMCNAIWYYDVTGLGDLTGTGGKSLSYYVNFLFIFQLD